VRILLLSYKGQDASPEYFAMLVRDKESWTGDIYGDQAALRGFGAMVIEI
jgi:hypothetical protein